MVKLTERPLVTLPEQEAQALANALRKAQVVLEYGSGGSTLMAAEMGKTVLSVESDAEWLEGMRDWFHTHPPKGEVVLHHADIGPTGKWGMPTGQKAFRKFPHYALDIWDHPRFRHPDLVLIDGRFRPACLLATAFRTTRPVTVLFDDYAGREPYHAIESMLRPATHHGRMAEFHLEPSAIPAEKLAWVMGWFLKPQ
ncbi:MAG: hypothetical protein ACK4HF_01955 [Paracoccaceae bacterium]